MMRTLAPPARVAALVSLVVLVAALVVVAAPGVSPARGQGAAAAPPPATATATYCVRGRGVPSQEVAAFASTTAQILAEVDGWSLGGTLRFVVRDDCETDFTLWLAAAEQLPSFGYPCHPNWSCRQGRNVVVNRTRWEGATTAWNAAGAPLADYRRMVVNHEVGHWLGFGHVSCPRAGAPAPVMQQQSKSLQGCVANPRPTASERERAARARGLEVLGPIADGDVVRAVGARTVYLVERGVLRAIPDPETLAARASFVRIVAASDLAGWSRGAAVPPVSRPLSADGTLLRVRGEPTVWVVSGERRHRIPDGCTFERRGFFASDVRVVAASQAAALPLGVPLAGCTEPPPQPRDLARACPAGQVPEDGFTDADDSAHEPAIDCAAWWDVAHGSGPGAYRPAAEVTRGQFASLVARLLAAAGGEVVEDPPDAFADDEESVHETSIDALAAAGLVSGTDAGFGPRQPVTRAQAATLLARVVERRTGAPLRFTRDWFPDDTASVHEDALNRVAEHGLLTGRTAGGGNGDTPAGGPTGGADTGTPPAGTAAARVAAPTMAVTRGQAASLLVRLADLLVERTGAALPG